MGTLTRIFSNFDSASQAREALLAQGFDEQHVSLEARDEEAGPVEGNFALASKDDNRVPAIQRGTLLLRVDTDSREQEVRAGNILAQVPGGSEGERLER